MNNKEIIMLEKRFVKKTYFLQREVEDITTWFRCINRKSILRDLILSLRYLILNIRV